MTVHAPERPAWRTASQRLFAGVLALLLAWHAMPAAIPAATDTPVVHIAATTPAATSLRDGAKIGQPVTRLNAARGHAGHDGAPPPALPPLSFGIATPPAASPAGWIASDTPALAHRTGDLYSARAPPTLS